MRIALGIAMLGIALVGCAGRDPMPIATVQPQDTMSDCTMVTAEIQANNAKVKQLADEQGWKVAQNVGAGVAGLVVWPLWFAMDFKGAADKDVAALQARQQYLAALAVQRCVPPTATSQRGPAARQNTARAPARVAPPPPPPPVPQIVAPEPEPEVAPYQSPPH